MEDYMEDYKGGWWIGWSPLEFEFHSTLADHFEILMMAPFMW